MKLEIVWVDKHNEPPINKIKSNKAERRLTDWTDSLFQFNQWSKTMNTPKPLSPAVLLVVSSEEKAAEINETNRKFVAVEPTEKPVLHEGDLATLKQFALFVAQQVAQQATSTDEIHQYTVALEKELARINQLPFVPTAIPNPQNLLNREDRYLLRKAKELQKKGKLRIGDTNPADAQS